MTAGYDDGDGASQRAIRVHVWRHDFAGQFCGRDADIVTVFEAVGEHAVGKIDDKQLKECECGALPGAGACGGQFTANTMACVSEAMGLALPNIRRARACGL